MDVETARNRLGSLEAQVSPHHVWYAILLLCVVNVFNYMDRMALSVLLPFIKTDLQLTDAELGFLVGFAFSIFYALFGIPIARWADRGVRRDIVAIALATWSAMTALSGAAQNFWQLFAARVGVGVGEAGCLPPSQSMLCDYVPLERRAGVLALQSFASLIGLMLGMALAGGLAQTVGWRWALVVLGVPGLAMALLIRLTLREPLRGTYDAMSEQDVRSSPRDTFRFLWRCKTYKLLIALMAINAFVQVGLYQWWPTFYTRLHGLGAGAVGIYLGAALGGGAGIGTLLGGWLANRTLQRDVGLPLKISAATTLVALVTALASLFVSSDKNSLLLVSLTGLLWNVPSGCILAAVYSVTKPAMRATAGAITIFFTSAVGMGLGPFCVGVLSDLLSVRFGVEALRYALLVPVALHPLLAILMYAAARHLADDLKAVGAEFKR